MIPIKKSLLSLFLSALIVLSLTITSGGYLTGAQSVGTSVNGIITTNTVWTQTNSPYTLTGNVLINNGVTLSIQPGTIVNLGSFFIQNNGTLQAIGSPTSPIMFNGGQIVFSQYSTNWNELTKQGSIIENANASSSLQLNAAPKICNSSILKEITIQTITGTPIIAGNIIQGGITLLNGFNDWSRTNYQYYTYNQNTIIENNIIQGHGISVKETNATIVGNLIKECDEGVSFYNTYVTGSVAQFAILTLTGNLFAGNRYGVAIFSPEDNVFPYPIIQNNTITRNYDGIYIEPYESDLMTSFKLVNNNIYDNTHYNFETQLPTNNFNAALNWWGTTDPQAIGQTIYDYYDNFNMGIVSFSPFLTTYNEAAPVYINATAGTGGTISPNGIISTQYGGSRTFTITPNNGYQISGIYVNNIFAGITNTYVLQNIRNSTNIAVSFVPNSTVSPTPTANSTVTPTSNPTPKPSSSTNNSNPTPTPIPTQTTPPKTPAYLTINCQSTTAYSNFKVDIQGTLTANNAGLSDAPIKLSYSIDGGESWTPLTLVSTDITGAFQAVWTPLVTGNYILNATYEGDTEHASLNTILHFAVSPVGDNTVFSVASNSTVTALIFNSTNQILSFKVTGATGTSGYARVYISKTLMSDATNLKVYLDQELLQPTTQSVGDSWLVTLTYHHSTHTIALELNDQTSITQLQNSQYLLGAGAIVAVLTVLLVLLYLGKSKSAKKSRLTSTSIL